MKDSNNNYRVPNLPKIYHITHVDNISRIVESGKVWSDAKRLELTLNSENIGMNGIKERRLTLPVTCHPGTTVGQYVPFYLCPRSVMLYIIHQANHPDLAYRGGQVPIVHLVMDVHKTIEWATENRKKWAFSDRNAGAYLADFYSRIEDMVNINWPAVESRDFKESQVKEGKQAEFLLHDYIPWNLVEKIGVYNTEIQNKVTKSLVEVEHKPVISIEKLWYF